MSNTSTKYSDEDLQEFKEIGGKNIRDIHRTGVAAIHDRQGVKV